MKFSKRIGAVAVAAAMSISATAASAQSINPWTGFYLGAHAGYGRSGDTDPAVSGFVGGIQGGYNWQFNQIVAGIEADYTFSGADASVAVSPGVTARLGVDSLWSIRARLGFLATSNAMIYGTVGYGGFELTGSVTGFGSGSRRMDGLVAGGGLEYAFTRNWLGRIEGLHYMGSGSSSLSGLDMDVTVFRAGLSYKF